MNEGVPVTQGDREAAALLFDRTSWQGWDSAKHPHSGAANHMLEGRGDGSPYVQAFARHRIASAPPAHPAISHDDDYVISEFAFLYRQYGLADDATLAPDAIELKAKVLAAVAAPPAPTREEIVKAIEARKTIYEKKRGESHGFRRERMEHTVEAFDHLLHEIALLHGSAGE